MDRRPAEPLTIGEAKLRLRLAAENLSPGRLLRDRPGEAAVIALTAGLILGGSPNLRRLLGRTMMLYFNSSSRS